MARPRQVRRTIKDSDGDITHLSGAFGTVPISQAIREVKSGKAKYAVGGSDLSVVNGPTREYLRSAPDGKSTNNLDNLPD